MQHVALMSRHARLGYVLISAARRGNTMVVMRAVAQ